MNREEELRQVDGLITHYQEKIHNAIVLILDLQKRRKALMEAAGWDLS